MRFPKDITLQDAEKIVREFEEFILVDKGDYIVCNYTHSGPDTFETPMHQEMRGLIFCPKSGKVISRRFHKFFNVGEREDTQPHNIDWNKPHVIMMKLDGSMISPLMIDGNIRWTTKMGITDIAMKAEAFLADKPNYSVFAKDCIERGLTPIFEYTGPNNKVVIDYDEAVVLLAIRDNITGEYKDLEALDEVEDEYNIPVIHSFEPGDTKAFIDHLRNREGLEGVVIQFEGGFTVKVKTDWYVRLHKAKDMIGTDKAVLELILNDSVDDVIPLLSPEDAAKLLKNQERFWRLVNSNVIALQKNYKDVVTPDMDKKKYDIKFVQKQVAENWRPLYYSMYGQPEKAREIVLDFIRKNMGQPRKISFMIGENYA